MHLIEQVGNADLYLGE